MNYAWLDLPDSILKVRLDISLAEMVTLLKKQKPIAEANSAKTAEEIREKIRQEKRSGCLGFLFQLIFGALIGIDPSSAIHPDHSDIRALEEFADHLEERTSKAFSDTILFVQFLKRSIDINNADVRTCYQQMHSFLCGRERLDLVLSALSKACGRSFVEENIRELLSALAEDDTMINPLKIAIKEQIDKTETASVESSEPECEAKDTSI